eukprot:CAMPEP_0176500304 /NCGR_PEP_ID=MMETSP0200_2-20121128/13454_1 /TAXON_ID=947934 /ORGANISM="Chaetoceros sp., Strain GSL56" /LENGTH=613 /DNA_ID=CAMNT_0017898911 /DNA_START=1723 /DNA_END=3561 /DNA_ORIENTATION=-
MTKFGTTTSSTASFHEPNEITSLTGNHHHEGSSASTTSTIASTGGMRIQWGLGGEGGSDGAASSLTSRKNVILSFVAIATLFVSVLVLAVVHRTQGMTPLHDLESREPELSSLLDKVQEVPLLLKGSSGAKDKKKEDKIKKDERKKDDKQKQDQNQDEVEDSQPDQDEENQQYQDQDEDSQQDQEQDKNSQPNQEKESQQDQDQDQGKESQHDQDQDQESQQDQDELQKQDIVEIDDQQQGEQNNETTVQVEDKHAEFHKHKGHKSSDSSSHKHSKKMSREKNGKEKYHGSSQSEGNKACLKDKNYSSHTAKTAYEMPFAALFKDTRGEKKFEASSIFNLNGTYYAVCDNSWAISKFDSDLAPFSDKNLMIGEPNREAEDSGYEAIFILQNTVYVVRESVKHPNGVVTSNSTLPSSSTLNNMTYHAIIEELEIHGNEYDIINQCSCEYEFEGDSKGFEGAFGLEGVDGELYILGLCEGNYCSESRKSEKGNGKIVLMKKKDCLWQTLRVIDVPSTAYFTDYSDISIRPNGKVAITTQEDSAVWIGQLTGIQNGKLLNPDTVSFDATVHEVYYFPKSNTCQTIYCNVEGITFINDDMLMAVSDQMKKGGKQPYW